MGNYKNIVLETHIGKQLQIYGSSASFGTSVAITNDSWNCSTQFKSSYSVKQVGSIKIPKGKKKRTKKSLYARINFLQRQNMPYFLKLSNKGSRFGSANSRKKVSPKKGPALVSLVI